MKVRVIEGMQGYYDHLRRHERDVFTIPDAPTRGVSKAEFDQFPVLASVADKNGQVPVAFSARWMEPVSRTTPERTSTAQEQINKKHDEEMASRMAMTQPDEGDGESADTGEAETPVQEGDPGSEVI